MDKFAKTLSKLIQERNVSVKEITEATGMTQSSISEYRSGSRTPTLGEPILKLAKFFGVSIEYLLTGEHPEETIIRNILDDAQDGFISIYNGTYRIKVEKYVGRSQQRVKK